MKLTKSKLKQLVYEELEDASPKLSEEALIAWKKMDAILEAPTLKALLKKIGVYDHFRKHMHTFRKALLKCDLQQVRRGR